jgi:hypothetical protein
MKDKTSVTINISNYKSEKELISGILYQFQFPNIYEESWEGVKQEFFYDSMCMVPNAVTLVGTSKLRKAYPECYTQLINCLKECQEFKKRFELIILD